MKTVFLITLFCALASAQFGRFQFPFGNFGRQRGFNRQFGRQGNTIRGGNGAVDNSFGGSDYHYSWRHAGFNTKWVWQGANNYCRSLGNGWRGVSINSRGENSLVQNAINQDRVPYIWTSGQNFGRGWQWGDGSGLRFQGWSRTGGARRPQPDNREGNESGLAVLNRFYNDGITWHDVAPHHQKPIICERG